MIGSPIYLVSACASGEEFVAAFRRYADKGGIFIPVAEPLPANRRGRFAMTLKDGGVMIEGEAEVVASSKSTSPLYGRVGMTIRFIEPDEPSKILLTELDKARLAPKVVPPSVAPRPAEIPVGPRPVPPAVSGRIDATNALAETVVIGDVASLKDLGPPKAGPKFVIPSIPAGRAKTPSAFPIIEARNRPASTIPNFEANDRPLTPGEFPVVQGGVPVVPSEGRTRSATTPPAPPARPRSATTPPTRARTGTLSPSSRDTQPTAVVPPPKHDPSDRRAEKSSTLPLSLDALKVGHTQAVAVVPPPQFISKNLFPDEDAFDTNTSQSAPPTGLSDDSGDRPPVAPPDLIADLLTDIHAGAPRPADQSGRMRIPTEQSGRPSLADQSGRSRIPTSQNGIPRLADQTGRTRIPTSQSGIPSLADQSGKTNRLPTDPGKRSGLANQSADHAKTLDDEVESRMTAQTFVAQPTPTSFAAQPAPSMTPIAMAAQPAPEGTDAPNPGLRANPPSLADLVRSAASSTRPRHESNPTIRSVSPPAPSKPEPERIPAPPIVGPTKSPIEALEADEPTDLTPMPALRMTSVGVGVPPPHDTQMMSAEPGSEPTGGGVPRAQAPTIEEPTPSGDWTMTPDGPIESTGQKAPATEGDWTITPDEATPEGWQPAVAKSPRPVVTQALPFVSKSKTRMIQAVQVAPEPVRAIEPKVQIDPTLMEPLKPMTVDDDDDDGPIGPPAPAMQSPAMQSMSMPPMFAAHMDSSGVDMDMDDMGSLGLGQPMAMSRPMGQPMGLLTPLPFAAPPRASATGQNPTYPMETNQQMLGYPPPPGSAAGSSGFFPETANAATGVRLPSEHVGDSTSMVKVGRRRRLLVIILSAVAVVAIGLVILFLGLGSKSKAVGLDAGTKPRSTEPNGSGSKPTGSAKPAAVGSDVAPDGGVAVVEPAAQAPDAAVAPPATTECTAEFATVPTGVEILDEANKVIGTSPTKLTLPCAATKLSFRKAGFVTTARAVTPTAAGAKVRVGLARPTVSVKVSSTPAGASITIAGKPAGVTPSTVKLAMFEVATITLTKDGFTPGAEKIVPRQNNQSVHVVLKKKKGR